MSFGPKLHDLPLVIPPAREIVITLQFMPGGEEFDYHATIYVEETTGIRPLEITVKSAEQGSTS